MIRDIFHRNTALRASAAGLSLASALGFAAAAFAVRDARNVMARIPQNNAPLIEPEVIAREPTLAREVEAALIDPLLLVAGTVTGVIYGIGAATALSSRKPDGP